MGPITAVDGIAGPGHVRFDLDNLPTEEITMLRWALAFAIIALIAGGLGFYGLAGVSADFAKFFALLFVVLFVIALVVGRSVIGGPTV